MAFTESPREQKRHVEDDVLVGVGAAVNSGVGDQADGSGTLGSLFGCQREAVQSGLFFNPVEFDGIKTGVVGLFPES